MKHLIQHFKTLTKHPQNANELKLLIKRLALEGKLTSDWRNKNSKFSGLTELEELKGKSTNRLSKRDKNEMQRVLNSFTKDDFPISWGLCNLSEIADFWNGKAHESSVEENGGFVLVNSRFVSTNGSRVKKVTSRLSPLKKSEIAIVMSDVPDGRALSRCYIVEDNDKYTLNQRIGGITPVEGVSSTFLAFVLDRNPHYLTINDGKKQTNLKRIHMISCPIPFPPLEEQKAIVEIVNELIKEVEQLEDLTKSRIQLKEDFVTSALQRLTETDNVNLEWQFLQTHFTEFFTEKDNVKQLRDTILQLAVQGKLTTKWRAQNPNTEPASELLKRIQKEKQELLTQKKIRKEKTLPQIEDNEKPYVLPDGWIWCRMLDFCFLITDGAHHTPKYVDSGVPFLSVKNLSKGFLDFSDTRFIEKETHQELIKRCNPEFEDILLTKIGTTGIAKVIDTKKEFSIFVSVALLKIAKNELFPEYIEHVINSPYIKNQSAEGTEGVGNKNLVLRKIKAFIVPLPPLEEQKAIVKQVNSLMALCDSLEEHIDNSQTQIEQLMQSCLREVFENSN